MDGNVHPEPVNCCLLATRAVGASYTTGCSCGELPADGLPATSAVGTTSGQARPGHATSGHADILLLLVVVGGPNSSRPQVAAYIQQC